jgi:hypothetical protein
MNPDLRNWEKKSGERQKLYKQYLHRADKNKVLGQLQQFHDEAFSKVDCLQCANCCKNYSPRFKTTDIKTNCAAHENEGKHIYRKVS